MAVSPEISSGRYDQKAKTAIILLNQGKIKDRTIRTVWYAYQICKNLLLIVLTRHQNAVILVCLMDMEGLAVLNSLNRIYTRTFAQPKITLMTRRAHLRRL